VRLIDGPLAGAMCPLFQTSANRSGEPAPALFADVPREVLAKVDVAIDGGVLTGAPSTVVDLVGIEQSGEWSILREGGLAEDELKRRLQAVLPD
jgi:tRNA A37 threonylcarbamoyladenosine synthetase subunit TsaC/SUA5/YrdC